jgi:hypothetical protein
MRAIVGEGLERERNRWDPVDSATMALGALCLAVSYVIR